MLQILKRDFQLTKNYFAVLAVPIIFSLLHIPEIPFTTYILLLYILLGATFFSESKKHVNRFFISLPIKKEQIVLARYVMITISTTLLTGIALVIERIFNSRIDNYSLITILFIFAIMYVIIAIALPVYYLFDIFWQAYLCQLLIFAFGGMLILVFVVAEIFHPFINTLLMALDWNPPLILGLFSFLMLAVSYCISCKIYKRKDF